MQVLDNSRRLHLDDAADATKHAISGITSGIKSAFAKPFHGLQNAFRPAPSVLPKAADVQPEPGRQPVKGKRRAATPERQPLMAERRPVTPERQPKATLLEAGPLPAGATVRVSVRSHTDDAAVTVPMERLAGNVQQALGLKNANKKHRIEPI